MLHLLLLLLLLLLIYLFKIEICITETVNLYCTNILSFAATHKL